jgi:hypothetical protein
MSRNEEPFQEKMNQKDKAFSHDIHSEKRQDVSSQRGCWILLGFAAQSLELAFSKPKML